MSAFATIGRPASMPAAKLQTKAPLALNIHLPHLKSGALRQTLVAPAGAAAEEVHGCVVHEVPDAAADEAVGTLIGLGGLDDFLLHSADLSPDAHKARVLLPVGTGHEAGVVRAQ